MLAHWPPLLCLLALAPLQIGDPAPVSLDVVALDGGQRTSLDLAGGQITIVDFFATWCPRCRESVASYQKLVDDHGDRVRIIVVDVGEPRATVRRFFATRQLPHEVLVTLDPSGAVMRSFGTRSLPSFYVLDQSGVIRDAFHGWGKSSAEELSESVGRLLGKPNARPSPRGKKRPRAAPEISSGSAADERARRLGVEILR